MQMPFHKWYRWLDDRFLNLKREHEKGQQEELDELEILKQEQQAKAQQMFRGEMVNNYTPRTASMQLEQKKKTSLMSKFKTFIGKTPKNIEKK